MNPAWDVCIFVPTELSNVIFNTRLRPQEAGVPEPVEVSPKETSLPHLRFTLLLGTEKVCRHPLAQQRTFSADSEKSKMLAQPCLARHSRMMRARLTGLV